MRGEERCTYPGCFRPVYTNPSYARTDKCIFHADKKDASEFRKALASHIRGLRRNTGVWDFRGFVFVDVPTDRHFHFKSNLFARAVFRGTANFNSARFVGEVSFRNSVFLQGIWFEYGVIFEGTAYFQGARMPYVVFREAQFLDQVHFAKAQFGRFPQFNKTIFRKGVSFSSAEFSGGFQSIDSQYLSGVNFWGATIKGHIWIENCEFRDHIGLARVLVDEIATFTKCTIHGLVKLHWPGDGLRRHPETNQVISRGIVQFNTLVYAGEDALLDLRYNMIQTDSVLIFNDCKMSQVLLQGTDCRQVRFYDCQWPRLLTRCVVGDEFQVSKYLEKPSTFIRHLLRLTRIIVRRPTSVQPLRFFRLIVRRLKRFYTHTKQRRENIQWRRLAITYQELSYNYRSQCDYPHSNDFDQGIFEARRLEAKARRTMRGRFDWILYSVYRALSEYSGSLWRPIAWLVLSIVAFAYFYWGTSYTALSGSSMMSFIKRSIQIASLNRIGFDFARDNSLAVDILIASQVAVTATLVALFLFAVRRRFKH